MGRDRGSGSTLGAQADFNPRARVGRDSLWSLAFLSPWNFNPRARVGRDKAKIAYKPPKIISIHAPAWGATFSPLARVSISIYFNPRARVGRDILSVAGLLPKDISIHAPAWGATPASPLSDNMKTNFNPRARVGRDTEATITEKLHMEFQSTRPRGARRRESVGLHRITRDFNPRARVGRDCSIYQDILIFCDFNPRARVGRDDDQAPGTYPGRYFNPRARVGRDQVTWIPTRRVGISIHAPAWGATAVV